MPTARKDDRFARRHAELVKKYAAAKTPLGRLDAAYGYFRAMARDKAIPRDTAAATVEAIAAALIAQADQLAEGKKKP